MKSPTSSPVVVLTSWCKLTTLHRRCPEPSLPGWARLFDQLSADFFRSSFPLSAGSVSARRRLFGRGQNALEPDDHKIADQVSVNALGATPHVFLLKKGDSCADGGFDFPWRAHGPITPQLRPQDNIHCNASLIPWFQRLTEKGAGAAGTGQAVPALKPAFRELRRKLTRVACPPRACGYFDQKPHPVCLAAGQSASQSTALLVPLPNEGIARDRQVSRGFQRTR